MSLFGQEAGSANQTQGITEHLGARGQFEEGESARGCNGCGLVAGREGAKSKCKCKRECKCVRVSARSVQGGERGRGPSPRVGNQEDVRET